MKEHNINGIDVMTSTCSTLPFDDNKMEKMVRLVQNARSTTLFGKRDQAY
jgi:hypothetical protein